jgi:hypothetical protein
MKEKYKRNTPNKLDAYKKVRKTWSRSPVEQIVPNKKKKYNRKIQKQQFQKEIRNALP